MPEQKIAALVLAAGQGSRMGGGKLTLDWQQGHSMLAQVLLLTETAACFEPLLCVTGHAEDEVLQSLTRSGINYSLSDTADCYPAWQIVPNKNWAKGQSSSLLAGLNRLQAWEGWKYICGIAVLLGDQPLIQAKTLQLLYDQHRSAISKKQAPIATAPVYQGKRGNPVILGPELIPELYSLQGDYGARSILEQLGPRLQKIFVNDAGVILDIDTPEDYSRFCPAL